MDDRTERGKPIQDGYRLNAVSIPAIRGLGFGILSFYVLLYDFLIVRSFVWPEYFQFVAMLAAYSIGSWLVLKIAYARTRRFDLPMVFLTGDILFWLLAVYRTGGEKSLLFFVALTRVADQTYTNFRRVLFFAHLTTLGYALLLWYLLTIENRAIDWTVESLKLIYVYGANIYIAITSRPAEALRKKSADAVRIARRLNWQLKRKSMQLEDAKVKAEAANRAKNEFLANVSHEIRTPMNAIVGMTELAMRTDPGAEQKRYLTTVKSSAGALLQIINDILDFSKIEAGKLDLHPITFAIRTTLSETLESLAQRASEKKLNLACQVSTRVPDLLVGDANRLRQVVTNLVSNAVKFTDRGEVLVFVELGDESGEEMTLHFGVSDTGIGVPEEKQSMIFESFVQADGSMTRRHGGTGLGLAISSHLVRLMGGRIWVESKVGQGSTFHFNTCFRKRQGVMAEAEPAQDGFVTAEHPLYILIAEDNPVNQQLATELLGLRGHRVKIAQNGIEVLAALETERFDAILMDVQMPEMDGFETTSAIRGKEKLTGCHVPIIAITGYAMKGDKQRCIEAGMDAYICKPVQSREMFEIIERESGVRS